MTHSHHSRTHPSHLPRYRLPKWQRKTLYASGAVLLSTGLIWLILHYSIGAGAGELPHPLEAWLLRLHGLAAIAGIFLFGALASSHVPQGWRLSHRWRLVTQQRTGVLLCCLAALLVTSSYLLYYFASEDLRSLLGGIHAAIGVAMAGLLSWHGRARA